MLSVRAGGDAAVLPPRAGKSSGAGAGGWAVLPGAAHLRRVPLCVGRELAGPDDFPRAVQAINLAYAVGVILFGPVPGLLADWTGSYIPAYLLFAALLTLAVALVRLAYARKKRLTV